MVNTSLEIRGLSKRFGGAVALSGVDFTVEQGEVHGLLGQNGSGKSTLIKVLAGYHVPDQGTVRLFGEDLNLPILDPKMFGIAIIHQDLALVDTMTVLENIGIGDGYGVRSLAKVNWRSLRRETMGLLRRLGSAVSPDVQVGRLQGTDRSIVAIARAMRLLSANADQHLFILDEPTAYLGAAEAERLMSVMRLVADEGSSVVFVSHKLGEVLHVTDRCTILRDGKVIATVQTSDMSTRELVSLQLGRDLDDFYPPMAAPPRERIVMDVAGLALDSVRGVDFDLREGEVLGLTGLAGMGQDHIVLALTGARRREGGTVTMHGARATGEGVRAALDSGIALVPADRKGEGLWLQGSVRENHSLPTLAYGFALRRINHKAEVGMTLAAMKRVHAKPLKTELAIGSMSGGNQQKALLAKWLATSPDVLVLHEPTQGVDAAARREILSLVNDSAEDGTGVIVCSTDYEQLANLCHRVVVLREGKVITELVQPFTESDLLLACQGRTDAQEVDAG